MAARIVMTSIPHIPFVIRDLVSLQEFPELVLKRHLAVMFLLLLWLNKKLPASEMIPGKRPIRRCVYEGACEGRMWNRCNDAADLRFGVDRRNKMP